jgi:tRNA (uracil-5-)-methyltransferase TRM9
LIIKACEPPGGSQDSQDRISFLINSISYFMKEEYAKYLLEKTKENYNQISETFSRSRDWLPPDFYFLSKFVEEEDKVLDIGCGNGRLKDVVSADYTGIDFSEKMIEIAKQRHPGTKFITTRPFQFPFEDKNFDKAFCLSVLHHIPSKDFRINFLKEILRVLKPDGELFLTVWDLSQNKKVRKLLFKYTIFKLINKTKLDFKDIFYPFKSSKGEILAERYIHIFSLKELKNLLKEVGFSVEKAERQKRTKKNSNLFLRGTVPQKQKSKIS